MQKPPEHGEPTPPPMRPTSEGLIPNPSFPIMLSSLAISFAVRFENCFLVVLILLYMDPDGDEIGDPSAVCDN